MGSPVAFFGETGTTYFVDRMKQHGIGRIWSTKKPCLYPGERWAFDNGAWSAYTSGTAFDDSAFNRRVAVACNLESDPYMAVCPDIVAGGLKSLDFSMAWIDRLPDRWPWYLAVQDGMKVENVAPIIDRFDGVFIGGTIQFKASSAMWKAFNVPVHYGRCGTRKRLRHAIEIGADSFDSSTPIQNGGGVFDMFLDCYLNGDPQGWLLEAVG